MIERAEEKLPPLPLSAQQVIENMHEGVLITDSNGIIQSVNRAFSNVTGWQAGEIIGKRPSVLQSGRHKQTFYKKLWAGLERTGFWQGEIYNRRKNGEI